MSASVLKPAGSTRMPPIAPMSTPRSRQRSNRSCGSRCRATTTLARCAGSRGVTTSAPRSMRPSMQRVASPSAWAKRRSMPTSREQVDAGAGGKHAGQVRQSKLVPAGVSHDRRHRVRRPLAERCVEAEIADVERRCVREQFGPQVQEPDSRRAQEPLHRGRDQGVHPVARDVDRHDAGGLGRIHQQHRAVRVGGIGDRSQVVPAAGERGRRASRRRQRCRCRSAAPEPRPRHRRRRWPRIAPPGRRGAYQG